MTGAGRRRDLLPYRVAGRGCDSDVVKRIVVGLDGSPPSRRALRWAWMQASRTGAGLRVVMAWENPSPDVWVPHDPPGTDRLAVTRHALERITGETLGDDPGVDVELVAAEGHAAKILVDSASDADLLVVGSRGHGGFAGVLLGSVSLHCVSHAPCPVVVVRGRSAPEGEEAGEGTGGDTGNVVGA